MREPVSTRAKVRGGLGLVSQPADWSVVAPPPASPRLLKAPSPGSTGGEEQRGVEEETQQGI